MNFIFRKYQLFTGAPFWIGFGRFKNELRHILEWQLGLGFMRINKYISDRVKRTGGKNEK